MDQTSPLAEALRSVPGVASAEIDDADGQPVGVRIRLDADADPAEVEKDVQRVLTAYGIRSRMGAAPPAGEPEEPAPERRRQAGPPPPPGAGAVLSLADAGRGAVPVAIDRPERGAVPPVAGASLSGISVEESRDGVVVTASTVDGRRESRRARWTDGGLEDAVVAAVAALHGEEAPPTLVGTRELDLDDTTAVLVVVERLDGRRLAGAAVVEAGAPFALARAVWAALAADS